MVLGVCRRAASQRRLSSHVCVCRCSVPHAHVCVCVSLQRSRRRRAAVSHLHDSATVACISVFFSDLVGGLQSAQVR